MVVVLLIIYKKIGLLIFSFTMALFTLYISYLKFKGFYEVCGCGGILNGLEYKYHLFINLSILLASLYALYYFNFLENEQ